MLVQPHYRQLKIEQAGDVMVAKCPCRSILEDKAIRTIGEHLFRLVESGHHKIVLSLDRLESMDVRMLAQIVALHHKLEGLSGKLAICELPSKIYEAFNTRQLPRLLHIYGGVGEALKAF